MALKTIIQDAKTQNSASVDRLGAQLGIIRPDPPDSPGETKLIFRQFFTDDGTSTGSEDMRVDGSVNTVDFFIPALQTTDLYIVIVAFVIADAGAVLNEFGNIGALIRGCRLFYERTKGEIDIHPGLQSNFDFVQLCLGNPSFGNAINSFRANNVVGLSEAFLPILDFRKTFGFPWGLTLTKGTTQKIVLRVRDDLTSVDRFDAVAFGFERVSDKDL